MGGLTPPRPLSAEDDRASFDCGQDSLNQWFLRHAWRNQLCDTSRTSVICDAITGAVAGYVSLSAAQIEREYLPKSAQRNRPDPVPVILLGQLAVDRRYHGQDARGLMFFALHTAIKLSKDVGCFGVITHPLDDRLRDFYRGFGFEDLPFDPMRAMIARIADLEASRAGTYS